MFEAKYNMSRELGIAYAHNLVVDSIWHSARLEGINVTFPETKTICEGGNSHRLGSDAIEIIVNLKRGWEFVFDTLTDTEDLDYLCRINSIVANNLAENAGRLRIYDVKIGGTNWKPRLPDRLMNGFEFNNILCIENPIERAFKSAAYCMRTQFFMDGNKRSSALLANKILINSSCGYFSVPSDDDNKTEYSRLLIEYYETSDPTKLLDFWYSKCFFGTNEIQATNRFVK